MIIKDKVIIKSSSPKINAGQKQELDVAFYLRRAFKDHDQVFVFNDIKLTHNNETAQIDHLIVHTFGFILIESKSITGEVTVNKYEEWSRSYNDKWNGMPSPIKQVELQKDLLKKLLRDHDSVLLNKLLGIENLQKGFGGRQWEHLCAISSNAIINRDEAPILIAEKLVKSEFIVDKVTKMMNLLSSKPNSFTFFKSANRPWFNDDEITKVCDFILQKSISAKAPKEKLLEENESSKMKLDTCLIKSTGCKEHAELQLKCKECNTQITLEPSWGKFGYYVKCSKCSVNTSMKRPCLSCHSKNTTVNKKKEIYTLNCLNCETSSQLIYKKEALCEK
tara:strand:- start:365 stop:1369 length:1005 start_codon:yes stop_codon:yes gene_type:complete